MRSWENDEEETRSGMKDEETKAKNEERRQSARYGVE